MYSRKKVGARESARRELIFMTTHSCNNSIRPFTGTAYLLKLSPLSTVTMTIKFQQELGGGIEAIAGGNELL
jgi:hypothetical protein